MISAGENYLLLRSTLIFHLISPIFAALFFVQSAKPTILPASGADFDHFIFTELPISYHFFDFYRELRPLPYLSFRNMVHRFPRCFSGAHCKKSPFAYPATDNLLHQYKPRAGIIKKSAYGRITDSQTNSNSILRAS